MIVITLIGCSAESGSESAASSRGTDRQGVDRTDEPRIVCFSPAIARTLADIELDRYVVGRTPWCARRGTALGDDVPIVGDLVNVDFERLVRVQPTHLLVQPQQSGIDPQLVKLAEERGWTIGQWQLNTVADVRNMINEIPHIVASEHPELLAVAADNAQALTRQLNMSLLPLHGPTWNGPVAVVAGLDPLMLYGRETYIDDVLRVLRAENAIDATGWVGMTLEDFRELNPPAIILVMPGLETQLGKPTNRQLGPLAGIGLEAVNEGRVRILSHSDALLPSSAIIEVADELRTLLLLIGAAEGNS